MKNSRLIFIPIAFLLCFSSFASALSIIAKEEAPYIGNELPGQGLSIEIINTALERAGYKTNYAFDTWPRSYEGALIGVYDVIGSIWRTKDREKDFAFSDAYLFHELKFIKRRADAGIVFNSLNDLQGLMIGTIKNYAYSDDFNHSLKFMRLPQNHLIQNLLFLTQGRIDITLGDSRKIHYAIKKYMESSMKDLKILPKALIKRSVHIAVSKSNPHHAEIIKKFNKALKSMKKDGTYAAIMKKHETQSVLLK